MDAPTIFFDLDGTLIDSRKDIANSVNLTRADYGLPPSPLDSITGMVGNGVRQLLLRAMPDHADEIAGHCNNRPWCSTGFSGSKSCPKSERL